MSQGITESVDRRARLQEAIRTTVDGERITNTELMNIWGVSKGRWSDIRNQMKGFPEFIVSGNVQLFPRADTLDVMWKYETRNDHVGVEKAARMAKLLGIESPEAGMPSISDMAKASALRADIEARMKEQGLLIEIGQLQSTAAKVFEFISRRMSSLGTAVDPNGLLPPKVRDQVDALGSEWLLRVHADMKHMLAPDVRVGRPQRATRARKPAGRSRQS